MRLSELINGDDFGAAGDVEIRGLAADSREVRPGYLFAALAGSQTDGARFIADAIDHGAVAVLAAPDVAPSGHAVTCVADANPRRRLALMAARFFGRQPATIAAVTGTNGKSSVAAFTRQIWESSGLVAASLGTLGLVAPGFEQGLAHTTPDPVTLHRCLAELADRGVSHLALEASSHGLDQQRLDGVAVGAAALTNLSRDHLDYHPTTTAYLAAKLRLFDTVMAPGGGAALNADSEVYRQALAVCRARGHRILSYGVAGPEVRLIDQRPDAAGQHLTLEVLGRTLTVELPLVGRFQAENALCAVALAVLCGTDPEAAVEALGRLGVVPGRVQLAARHPSGAPVYVDYAHTPGALKTILQALRPHTPGRLVVAFGCGGDRDRGKRPEMGAIARELADRVFVTDDNPRTEDRAAIRADILSACPDAVEIGDRAEAIATAVAGLEAGDCLVVAGKGHERGQIVGDQVRPFDDAAEVQAAVAAIREPPR